MKSGADPLASPERVGDVEAELRAAPPCLLDHRRRQVHATRVGASLRWIARDVPRPATEVAHQPDRASSELAEQTSVKRLAMELVVEACAVLRREPVLALPNRVGIGHQPLAGGYASKPVCIVIFHSSPTRASPTRPLLLIPSSPASRPIVIPSRPSTEARSTAASTAVARLWATSAAERRVLR